MKFAVLGTLFYRDTLLWGCFVMWDAFFILQNGTLCYGVASLWGRSVIVTPYTS